MAVEALKARLLVAAPGLSDPNFDRTVVFLLEHTGDGAVGVVLNRPSDTEVRDVLPAWTGVAAPPAVVFAGGPVVPTGAIALGRAAEGEPPEGFVPVLGRVGVVQLSDAEEPAPEIEAVRVFAGHAGWGGGQIETEIAAGGWIVIDADADDPFTADPTDLWKDVLARQRGPLAWFANAPADPRTN